jgi:hypothetical protein
MVSGGQPSITVIIIFKCSYNYEDLGKNKRKTVKNNPRG